MGASRSFKGFVPHTSFVMAKRKNVAAVANRPADTSTAPHGNVSAVPPSPESSKHEAIQLLFLEESATLHGDSHTLLEKMIAAMNVNRETTLVSSIAHLPEFGAKIPGRVIVTLGQEAAQEILKTSKPLSELRARVHRLPSGQMVVPTLHPAFLLAHAAEKKDAWEDLKLAMRELDVASRG